MSDLHVDSSPFLLPPTPAGVDCIVIAGDVADGHHKAARWLLQQAIPRGLPIINVAGNHDFYGHDIREDPAGLMQDIGIEFLHERRPTAVIAGTRFVGSTLWTDYAVAGDVDQARSWGRRYMPDIRDIDMGLRRIGTRDLLEAHQRQRSAIEAALALPFPGPTVVVTHHAPHPKSARHWPRLDASDGSYVSDLSALMEKYRPTLWIHGHTHHSHDYLVGSTRVVCNPRGYDVIKRGEALGNAKFAPSLVIEVPGPRTLDEMLDKADRIIDRVEAEKRRRGETE